MDGIPRTLDELRATLRADLARNRPLDQRLAVTIFRLGQFAHAGGSMLQRALRVPWIVLDKVYLRTMSGAELPPQIRCGPGLALPHAGRGVVIHPYVAIGANAMIYHRVTLADHRGTPVLGDYVIMGAGSAAHGPITIGRYAHVGINAVVTKDVEPFAVAVGIPATVKRVRDDDRRGVEAEERRAG